MKFLATACALAALANSALALPKITRVGRYLFNPDGSRFYIKGIAYQEQGRLAVTDDPNAFPEPDNFVDPLLCQMPASAMFLISNLTVNAIRVYSVNASLNHDDCMAALDAAGIYTMIDLSLPVNGSLDRSSPAWTTNLLDLYIGTIDVFSKNVLAYNIGNEVVTDTNNTVAAPFIKAAARDVKAYLKSKGSSALVGYASTDGSGWRDPLANYLACDRDDDSLDIYGQLRELPCRCLLFRVRMRVPTPRLWTEATALFSSQMTPVWSGGLAFSYFPAVGGYGMIELSADNATVTTSDDYTRLQNVLSNITFVNEPTQSNAAPSTYPACPAASTDFLASSTLPPTPNTATCECIKANSFSCLFTPTTEQGVRGVGQLLDNGCQLLGQAGGTCDAIAGNGQTGVYGPLSGCSPETKLSYVFSQYYERTNRNAQSCSFGGNATVANPLPSSSEAAAAAQSSCITSGPTGVVTPTAPATTRTPVSTSTSGSNGGGNGNQNGVGKGAVVGLAAAIGAGLVSAVWVAF
ncbi:1,3-beta-glucanosyltransferase [Rhizoctonia solani]|uniref:1,3-beta-glucanosyltransferase n=1 Tax=Rhizoctonia solani TaxID=456999 RepID=A0A8H7IJ34_9AGAM|nr:1,3-beta-glucanosyltransferase [Rhizoctonia solani]